MKQRPRMISVVVAAVRPSSSEPPASPSTKKIDSSEAIPIAIPAGKAKAASARSSRPR
jgi:hypothetical protein